MYCSVSQPSTAQYSHFDSFEAGLQTGLFANPNSLPKFQPYSTLGYYRKRHCAVNLHTVNPTATFCFFLAPQSLYPSALLENVLFTPVCVLGALLPGEASLSPDFARQS